MTTPTTRCWRMRWTTSSHVESDEAGALNQWLAAAPNATPAHGGVGCNIWLRDMADREPRALKDGETLDWKNDKTQASGSVTALNRLEWNGLACRRLRIYNAYGELKAKGVYKFCEKPAGKWKLVGPDESPP